MDNMSTAANYHNDWMDHYNDSYEPPPPKPYEDMTGYDRVNLYMMSVVIYSVVCVLGVLGNGVVIWATGFRMKKTVSTAWYLNLAVADFLVTASLPLRITFRALASNKHSNWDFIWFMCKMDSLVFYMNMYASIFTLAVISVDRCVCVVCPVWTRNHRTVRKASWVSLGVWVMALAPSIPHVIFGHIQPSGLMAVQCFDDYESTTIGLTTNFVVGFVVPFSVIVSCYSVVIYRLRNNRSLASQSCRSFKIIAAVIAAFFLCWVPFHIIRLIFVCGQNGLIEYSETLVLVFLFGKPITFTLALVNSCVNPLLYVFSQGLQDVFHSRSILKVLEKAFAGGEPPQTNNTPTDPGVTQIIVLSEIEGSTGPAGTQDPSP